MKTSYRARNGRNFGRLGPRYLEALESRTLLTADYTTTFAPLSLASHVVSGATVAGTATLKVVNVSNAAFSPAGKADLRVVARPVGAPDSSTDVLLGTKLNVGLGFKVGGSASYSVKLTVPGNAPVGNYDLLAFTSVAAVAGDGLLLSTGSAGAGGTVLTVDPQVLDLSPGIVSFKMAANAIAGGTSGLLVFKMNSVGNVPVPAQSISARITATPIAGGSPIVIDTTNNIPFPAIAPGKFLQLGINFTLPLSLSADSYHFGVTLSVGGAAIDANAGNDTATAAPTITVVPGHLDLSAVFGTAKIPPLIVLNEFTSPPSSIQVKLTNKGNIAAGSLETAAVKVFARPVGAADNAGDILLGVANSVATVDFPIYKLKVGGSVTANVALSWPTLSSGGMPEGAYEIVATVSDVTTPDPDLTNNTVIRATPVQVQNPFVDIQTTAVTTALKNTLAGQAKGTASVAFKNNGNIPASGYTVEIYATTDGTIDDTSIRIGRLTSASLVKPGGAAKATVAVTLPDQLSQKTYKLAARVIYAHDPTADNDAAATTSVTVAASPAFLGTLPMMIQFTETSSSDNGFNFNTGGTIEGIGTNGSSGTYSYSISHAGPSTVSSAHVYSANINFTFNTQRLASVDGLTLVLTRVSAGSDGTFTIANDAADGLPAGAQGYFQFI